MLEWILELVRYAALDTLVGKRHRVAAYIIIAFLNTAGLIFLFAYWTGPRDDSTALLLGIGALALGLVVFLAVRSSYRRHKRKIEQD